MLLNAKELEEKDMQEFYEKNMDGSLIATDMTEDLYKSQNKYILGVSILEIERQCQNYRVEEPFDYPLNISQNPMDSVIEGGIKILNNEKILKRVRSIYKQNNN